MRIRVDKETDVIFALMRHKCALCEGRTYVVLTVQHTDLR
jgi:hypothetical protein